TDASLGQITAAALVLDTTGAADIFVNGVGLHPTLNGVTLNSGGDITFDAAGSHFSSSLAANGADITVAGNLSAGTALALNASAAISQTGGAVTSPLVTLSAGTAITQSGGTISGTTAVLDAGTTISQSGGATINVGLLSGHSTGGTSLNDANLVDNLTGFTNAGVGGFSLADAKSLNVSGPVAAGTGDLAFQVTGALTTAADLTAGGTVALSATGPGVAITQISGTIHGASVSLDTTGAISQTGGAISAADVALDAGTTITQTGGSIAAGTLQGSSDGDTTLANPDNTVATLGTFNVSGGSFTLADSGTLTVAGTVSAGTAATITTGDLDLTGIVTAGTTLALGATNTITQSAGAVSGSSVTLDAGTTIAQSGGTISGSAVELDAGATISQSGGATITAGTLTGHSAGGATLNDANLIASLNGFTAGGDLAVTDNQTLTVTAAVSGADVALKTTTGDLDLAANVSAPGTVDLVSAGTVSQSGGIITAATLTGSSAGSATLNDANLIANLGSFTNTGAGGFSLTDAQSLNVTGAVAAGSDNLALNVTGDLGVGADLTAGKTVTLTASGAISQT